MASQHGIEVNQNIRVTRAGYEEDWYVSSVQDISNHDFCISVPTQGQSPLVLHNGDIVKISLVSEKMARIEFETKVIGWRYDNIPLYVLALPKDSKRIQLRNFVRIPVMLEVYFSENVEGDHQPAFTKCTSLDISGGGIRLLLRQEYPAGTRLNLRILIPLNNRTEEVEVVGRVVRSWPDKNVNLYQTAIQFTEISRKHEDLIVRFVLSKMSQQRRLR